MDNFQDDDDDDDDDETPDVLYRYMSLQKASAFFKDGKLRFSKPSDYNDPFEFSMGENRSALGSIGDWFSSSESEHRQACRNCTQLLSKLYSVCCFSEKKDNLLMWAHYARSYTGVVIGFSNAITYWEPPIQRVNYKSETVKAPQDFTSKNIESLPVAIQKRILVTKADCWAYEEEWRCVKESRRLKSDKYGKYMKLRDQRAVVEIIFGYKIELMKRKRIYKKAKQMFPDAEFYVAMPNKKKFKLDIIEIIDDDEE